MRGILGKKLGMTQIFKEGEVIPVTVVKAGPCIVSQIKKPEKDGYSAIQIGFEEVEEKKLNKPLIGHFKKSGVPPHRYLTEVRLEDEEKEKYKVGQKITVEIFQEGEKVDVTGVSKGKGFAGVVKRWGFRGFPASHGSRYHRAGGSIGMAAFPARVIKGMRMPGRLGNRKVTVQNLEVVKIDKEKNLLLLKGAVPGFKGSLIFIKEATKAREDKSA